MTLSSNSPGAPDAGKSTSSTAEQAKQKVELRQRARTDKMFLARLLGYDFCDDVHTDLFANYIPFNRERILYEQSDIKRRLILWSRGFYKTTSIVVEAVQLILNFPDISIMVMKDTRPKGSELLTEIRGHFDGKNGNSKIDTLFPEFCGARLGNSHAFTVPARTRSQISPTVFVASPRSSKAGWHPDAAFFDDLVTEQNYKNPDVMKQVIQDFAHYEPLVNPGGYFYVTGTRYTFGDLYEHIMRQDAAEKEKTGKARWQVTTRGCWPVDANGNRCGESFFPKRRVGERIIGISTEELLALQRDDPETFSAQYLNRPIAAGLQQFTEQLLLSAVRPRQVAGENVGPAVLFVDLAESKHAESDKSVVLCGRQINACPTVCDLRSGLWPTLQLAQNILDMAVVHRPARVLIEGSAGSTFFLDYLRMIAKDKGVTLPLDTIKVSNQKAAKYMRISAVQGAIKTNRLKFLVGLPGWTDLVQQFVEFPKGRHDDEIDTVSLMVQFYSGHIASTEPMASGMPWFLQQPGANYSLESQITQAGDDAFVNIPEPVF